ncbi:hypothetical protein STAS_35459, partial [Striga asiatica]
DYHRYASVWIRRPSYTQAELVVPQPVAPFPHQYFSFDDFKILVTGPQPYEHLSGLGVCNPFTRTTLEYLERIANSETRKMLEEIIDIYRLKEILEKMLYKNLRKTHFFIDGGKSTEYDGFRMIIYQLWLLRPS